MRWIVAAAMLAVPTVAMAETGYVPFVFGGGEVAIRNADGGLQDWRVVAGEPAALLVHDQTGQWYRVAVGSGADCRFRNAPILISGYGTDPSGLFGPGMWIQQAAYPYRRCRVRSTRPVATPADQVGVDYTGEYAPTPKQAVARILRCRRDTGLRKPSIGDGGTNCP